MHYIVSIKVGLADGEDGGSKATTVQIANHKFDHDLRVKICYDRQMAPVAILSAGRRRRRGFLQRDVVALNFFPDLGAIKGAKLKKAEFIFIVDRSGTRGRVVYHYQY